MTEFKSLQPDLSVEHELFCKAARPSYGVVFNLDTGVFETLGDSYRGYAEVLNNMFAGWILSQRIRNLQNIVVGTYFRLNDQASKGKTYVVYQINDDHFKLRSLDGVRYCRSWRIDAYFNKQVGEGY